MNVSTIAELELDQYPENSAVYDLEVASKRQRCINFVVDNLIMKFSLAYFTSIGFAWILGLVLPTFTKMVFESEDWLPVVVAIYMVSRVNYVIYYTISEKFFNGYTLGKLVSGTRAIREDGEELTFLNAVHRSFSRFLPFEFLSGFSERPWHDSWTKTTVISTRQ
jgi:uncharacterized RDD family membrane protein YckC